MLMILRLHRHYNYDNACSSVQILPLSIYLDSNLDVCGIRPGRAEVPAYY